MQTCNACNAEVDELALAAGRCSKCGAALLRVPRRTLQGLPEEKAGSLKHPLDLETVANFESLDLELVGESRTHPVTIQTLDLSTIGGGAAIDAPSGKKPETVAFGGERTIEFDSAANDPAIAESRATAQWEGNFDSEGARPNRTLKQLDTVTDSKISRSSVVVKSRQFRSPEEAGRPVANQAEAPDYELLDLIGEGGMGVVYSARQSAIARTVAVKMLKRADASRPEQREKFISEAVVTGELDHPNIVPIYDLGTNNDGALFYSMKRVKGTPWDNVLGKKSLDENLSILLRVADAVAFAHANGVIHRDLKPENTMLGDYGEVLVMDWGLARISPEFPNAASVSQSDVMGGTPAYMAPEMATGPIELVTTASDVYLLGAILYEIITGHPPHSGRTVMACLLAAAKNQIVQPEHSSELGEIALRAMATKPEDRYPSVQEFQQAIRLYQSHSESVLLTENAEAHLESAEKSQEYELFARALYGFEEALSLWPENQRAKRLLAAARSAYAKAALERSDFDLGISLLDSKDPEQSVLYGQLQAGQRERASRTRRLTFLKRAVAALLLAIGGIVSTAFVVVRAERDEAVTQRLRAEEAEGEAQKNYRAAESARQVAETERQRAEEARGVAVTEKQRAEEARAVAETERERAEQARQVADTQRERAETEEAKAVAAKQAEEYEAYIARIGLANAKLGENAFDRAGELLAECNPALSNWEWGRLAYLADLSEKSWPLDGPVEAVSYSPDGHLFATGDLQGNAQVWDAATGKVLHTFSPGQYVHSVAFDPQGTRLAVGGSDKQIRIYEIESEKLLATLSGHEDAVLSVQFSADGAQLLSAGYDNTARIWNAENGQSIQTLQGHNWWVWAAEFSPDGRRIVTASQDGKAIIWQWDAAAKLFAPATEFAQHRGPVYAAQFSPDGKQVATAGYDRRILLWNPADVRPVDIARRLDGKSDLPSPFVELGVHAGPARTLAFAPDGKTLATGGQDNVLRIWQLVDPKQIAELRGHASHVRDCVYSPDGTRILSAGRDQQIKLWQPAAYAERIEFAQDQPGESDAVLAARFARDGNRLVTASRDRSAAIWDIQSRKLVQHFSEGHEFLASTAAFFADGGRLATSAGDGTVRLWDVSTGTQLQQLPDTGYTAAMSVSPDGRWIASGSSENEVKLWDAQTGQQVTRLAGHEAPVTAIRFAENSQLLVTGDDRGRCCLWQLDPQTNKWSEVHWLTGHSRAITAVGFAQKDRILITASGDNTCGLWDVASGKELRERVLKHPDWVADMVVSRDGTQVLTSCDDGKLRLWSLEDSRLLDTIEPSDAKVVYTGIDLSADGKLALATCAATGEVFLWNLADHRSAVQEKAWLSFGGKGGIVWSARFSPTSDAILTIGGNDARLWNMAARSQIVRFSPHGAVADADIAPDGRTLVTGSWDSSAKIWDVATGKALRKLDGVHQGYVNSVQFSADGSQVLTASDDGTARLWESATGEPTKLVLQGHESRIRQARFDAANALIVTASSDKTARVWNAKSGEQLQILKGHQWAVLCGEFSHDGKQVITGGEDNVAIVWDANSGEQLVRLAGHTDAVTSVALSPDGLRALTGSRDNTVKLWDAQTGKEILTLNGHREEVTSVSFSPDGLSALSSGRDGTTILWPARDWKAPRE